MSTIWGVCSLFRVIHCLRKSGIYVISKKFWISAAFIPGKHNCVADHFSRVFHVNTEWMLNPLLFKKICDIAYTPEIDLFASRINKQIDKYVSWHPDPEAIAIDAFSLTWDHSTLYMFPPFSIITKVTKKIAEDKATGILIVPDWPSQVWYPKALSLGTIIRIQPHEHNLISPQDKNKKHPLSKKTFLLVIQGQKPYLRSLQVYLKLA